MRPRICLAIVSSTEGKLTFREPKSKIDYNKRRADFFKNRVHLECIKNATSDLMSFNNGVANAIQKFKTNKRLAK